MASIVTSDGPVDVARWSYQLQGRNGKPLDPAAIAAVATDLMVVDYARDGTEASVFTPTQVDLMQGTGADRKVVLAYVSIGETEDFRFYWDADWTSDGTAGGGLTNAAPDWLGPVNPDWPESRKVRYWDPEWQAIAFEWIETVATQGFDGAYLDIVDAYYFWAHEAKAGDREPGDPASGAEAAARMIDFIVALAEHGRAINPDFVLIQQNAAFLLSDLIHDTGGGSQPDPDRVAALHDAIAGIAVEDIYLPGGRDENNPFRPDREAIDEILASYGAADELLLSVDYATKPGLIQKFLARAEKDGFIPYAAPDRDLANHAIHGTPGADVLDGSAKGDRIYGRGANDKLSGGDRDDVLIGGPGRDRLAGEKGNDRLIGGDGRDRFVFDTALGGAKKAGTDTIADFTPGTDTILLERDVFTAIGGKLGSGELRFAGNAKDDNDYVIYKKKSGALFYDADADGNGAKVKFAKIDAKLDLVHEDFLMV